MRSKGKMNKLVFLFVLAAVFFIGYLQGFNDAPYEYITKNIAVPYPVEKIVKSNETQVKIIEIEKTKYIPQTINITMNITALQEKQLRDLRCDCNNIGCSEGCIQAKYRVYDIMGWKRPKFSEKPATGLYAIDNTQYIPVKVDGFGVKYLELNNEWILSSDLKEPMTKQFLCDNLTFSNSTKWMQYKGTSLYIRHV